jgi:hypothetical protein
MDEVLIGHSHFAGNNAKIRMLGMQSCQRVNLQEVLNALGICSQVYPSSIKAAKAFPCSEGYFFCLFLHRAVDESIFHQFLTSFFV